MPFAFKSNLQFIDSMRLIIFLLLVHVAVPLVAVTTTDDKVYSVNQAQKGKRIYDNECASCHARTLRGAEGGTPLIGKGFLNKWKDKPLSAFLEYLHNNMPPGREGKLSNKAYVRLIAYMLQENGFAAGEHKLSLETDALSKIVFNFPTARPRTLVSTKHKDSKTNIINEWRYYGGDAASQRYSSLDIINRDNVSKLEIAWRWKANNFGPRPEFNYRTTPLMVDRTLYFTAGLRRVVVAADARTGETLWTFRIDEGERGNSAPRVNSGRGVAYWENGDDKRIIFITPAFQLLALDARTGQLISSFGNNGKVDLKLDIDRKLDPVTAPLGSSSPPIIVNDVIVVGSALPGGMAPPSAEMPPGHVRGYDVKTGERRWIFHTIPQPEQTGYDSWEPDAWHTIGNVAMWTTMSADQELGYVYLPLEAPTSDHYGGHRPGDNLFSQSLVCLDARTGKRVWHFQTVHHGIWDYDLPSAPILLDIEVDGRKIPAIAQLTKQAFTFVFDRRTGEPVWPIEERPVPQSDVPGEYTSPTQPFPTLPAPFDRQGITENDLIDFTPELRAEAVNIIKRYRTGPLYTPPSVFEENGNQGTLMLPYQLGGSNWPGGAVDPETGILYVTSATWPGVIRLAHDPDLSSLPYVAIGSPVFNKGPQGGLPLVKPPWGRITAINMNSGKHVWMIANADTHESISNHPALKGMDLPRLGRPERGGLLVTKTLLFAGEGAGMFGTINGGGNMFRAHDKNTGEIISEFELPANQSGLPMTYAVDGKQFIVMAIGAPDHPGELIALSIPETD